MANVMQTENVSTEVKSISIDNVSANNVSANNVSAATTDKKNIKTNKMIGGRKGIFQKFFDLYMKLIKKYRNILFAIVIPIVLYIAHVRKTFVKIAKPFNMKN